MTQTDPTNPPATSSNPKSAPDRQPVPVTPPAAATQSTGQSSGITSEQAEQIISQLKSLKQNLFILTLIGGFFALRAILFHR